MVCVLTILPSDCLSTNVKMAREMMTLLKNGTGKMALVKIAHVKIRDINAQVKRKIIIVPYVKNGAGDNGTSEKLLRLSYHK